MELTSYQNEIKNKILSNTNENFILRGYAGTGKTVTLTEIIKEKIKEYKEPSRVKNKKQYRPTQILIVAPTAKALSVLREKVRKEKIDEDYLSFKTTASLLKTPIEEIRFMGKSWKIDKSGTDEMINFLKKLKIDASPSIKVKKIRDVKKNRDISLYSVDERMLKLQISEVHPNLAKQPISIDPSFLYIDENEILNKYKDYDLMIVDETSMIPEDDVEYLRRFPYTIMAGDPGQLPPVGGKMSEHFLQKVNNKNVFELTEMLRSTDNVLNLALKIRQKEELQQIESPNVKVYNDTLSSIMKDIDFSKYDVTLSFTNKVVDQVNKQVRKLKYNIDTLEVVTNDVLVCTQNSGYDEGQIEFTNGSEYRVLDFIDETEYLKQFSFSLALTEVFKQKDFKLAKLQDQNGEIKVAWIRSDLKWTSTFNENKKMLDYMNQNQSDFPAVLNYKFGQALSVHKSQGSEWPKVLYILTKRDLWIMGGDATELNYTAVTRAKTDIDVIICN